MNEQMLECVYQENLEERLIAYMAKKCNFSYERAMEVQRLTENIEICFWRKYNKII